MAFLFYFILILIIVTTVIVTSKINIEIEKFKYKRKTQREVLIDKKNISRDNDVLIKFKLYIFNIIPILILKIDNKKINKLRKKKRFVKLGKKLKTRMNKMQTEFIEKFSKNKIQEIVLNILTIAKELKLKVKKLNLQINVGLSNIITTTFLIPAIATAVSFFFRNTIVESKQSRYEIKPIYNLENSGSEINIYLKCIIEVKMIHIINIMYIIKKQRKVKEYGRPSNRRSYEYSYE